MPHTALAGENPEIISPIVIEGAPLAPSTAPSTPSVPGRAQSSTSTLGILPASGPDTVVQGFANNVPLAVALREILPPGYGFSIDQDVDLGTLVSFQGGKSWRETLQSMLQPADLVMREQSEMVAIGRSQGLGGVVAAAARGGDECSAGLFTAIFYGSRTSRLRMFRHGRAQPSTGHAP